MYSRLDSKPLELFAACCLGTALALMIVLSADFDETKHRVVFFIGAFGVVSLWLIPDRRALAAAAWIPLHTLGLEKVFEVADPLDPHFEAQYTSITAADCILLLLLAFELADAVMGRRSFRLPRSAIALGVLIIWAGFSYLMHKVYLKDGLIHSSPLNLLHLLRTLGFIIVMNSAIRSRGDLILISLALLVSILFQSMLVSASYATGEVMNIGSLFGETQGTGLMTFSDSSGDSSVRASGSIGHTNEQAAFHALTTLPLLALLALRSPLVRFFTICTVAASTIALILTFSRGGWLSYFISFCIFFGICLWRREIKSGGWYLLAISAVLGTLALGALSEKIYDRLTKGDEGATDSRIRMIMLAVDLAIEQPLIGVGPGEFAEGALKYYPPGHISPKQIVAGEKPESPTVGRLEITQRKSKTGKQQTLPLPVHNKYLLVLSELGVMGLLLFLIFYWQFLKASWNCIYRNDVFIRLFGIAGFASIVGCGIYMMLDLFADDKSITTLLLIPVLAEAASVIQSTTNNRQARTE